MKHPSCSGSSTVARPPCVLWVSPEPEFKAATIFIERQIESLLAVGVNGRTFHLRSRTAPGVMFREWRRLRAELREFQPDLIHAQYGTATAFIATLAATCPLVVTFRGSDLNPDAEKGRLRCSLGRLMSQLATLRARSIICVSEQLAGRLWFGKGKVEVITSGINTSLFRPRPRAEARAQLAWTPNERIVLFSGAHRPLKRLDLARAAVEEARRRLSPIQLVELDGRHPPEQMPTIMNAADCLLVTSDHEGSPNVVKEAMACGLPVVSRDVGDVRQRLADVRPSHVTGSSAVELGQALADVLARCERSNGPEVAREFSVEAIANQIVKVYNKAAAMPRNIATSTGASTNLRLAR